MLKDLNKDLSQKLEAQTQRLELLTAQRMANENLPTRPAESNIMLDGTQYADEGDEVLIISCYISRSSSVFIPCVIYGFFFQFTTCLKITFYIYVQPVSSDCFFWQNEDQAYSFVVYI